MVFFVFLDIALLYCLGLHGDAFFSILGKYAAWILMLFAFVGSVVSLGMNAAYPVRLENTDELAEKIADKLKKDKRG